MTSIKSSFYDDVLIGFHNIPEREYARQVYFVEKNREIIAEMDSSDTLGILELYNKALFELGHYEKCLENIDQLIYDVLDYNYSESDNDIFCALLFRKACAQFNAGRAMEAVHVSKELLKIDPYNKSGSRIFRTLQYYLLREKFTGLRSIGIIFLIFGLCMTCFDLLVVDSFYPGKSEAIELVRNFSCT